MYGSFHLHKDWAVGFTDWAFSSRIEVYSASREGHWGWLDDGTMGLWDCPGELKKEGRNDAVEVPEREVKSSGIVGGECSVVCLRGPAGSHS